MPDKPNETAWLLAEGQAALLLAESILLALTEAKILSKEQAIEAIETVIAAKRAMAAGGRAPTIAAIAVGLLTDIENSINAALGGPGTAPDSGPPRGVDEPR